MNILIIGSGAREHALAETLLRTAPEATAGAGASDTTGASAATGAAGGANASDTTDGRGRLVLSCLGSHRNPGIESICAGTYVVGDITDPDQAVAVARAAAVELAIIGPEAPLATGTADALWDAGVPVVGPRRIPAQIETSKAFCRELLRQVCPEAVPAFYVVTTPEEAESALRELGEAYVVKADGLAGGKGVKVAGEHLHSHGEALDYCREVLADASRLVIEEKLVGEEFSLLSFTDGETCLHMPPAQDHKRAYEGDTGPNTGGMGSYTDADGSLPFLGRQDIVAAQRLNEAVVRGIREITGVPYQGILYGGFMAGPRGVAIVEYNARFGDPEALNILPLLERQARDAAGESAGLLEICRAITTGTLAGLTAHFRPAATVCKYLVPPGYPERGEKGLPVTLPEDTTNRAPGLDSTALYLGSLTRTGDQLVSGGSRTVAVTGIGATLDAAEAAAERTINRMGSSLYHRRDIGTVELVRKRVEHMDLLRASPLRLGILGSTRGTSTEALIAAAEGFALPASVEVVITDRRDAPILDRAREHGIPAYHVQVRRREDKGITEILRRYRVDLVICVGYMRILSGEFCTAWRERVINVHPSLLPDFAGGMDGDVHAAVLEGGRSQSGCTVHLVTEEVDGGPILLQQRCPVYPSDTANSLKARVQALEADALIEAVVLLHRRAGRNSGGAAAGRFPGIDSDFPTAD